MTVKTFTNLLAGFMFLCSGIALGQSPTLSDSAVQAPSTAETGSQAPVLKRLYHFLPKPRSQTEIGFSAGLFTVSGDVTPLLPTEGFTVHVRKAIGYLVSLRLQYLNGIAKGLNWRGSIGYINNPAWADNGYKYPEQVFYNYRTHVQDLSLQAILSLNNIRFHQQKINTSLYTGVGLGATIYDSKINALNGNVRYDFSPILNGAYKNRKEIRRALKRMMDNTYETQADNDREYSAHAFGQSLRPSGSVLAGIAFKINNQLNISVEDRFTMIKDDLLDGQRWQERPVSDPVLTSNFDTYNYMSAGININIGARAIQPLWWINPLDYVYREIRRENQ